MEKRKPYVTGLFENFDGKICEIYELYNLESKVCLKNNGEFENIYFIAFYDYVIDEENGTDTFPFISRERISEEVYKVFSTPSKRKISAKKMTDEDIENIIE